jgi:hypothetical protein
MTEPYFAYGYNKHHLAKRINRDIHPLPAILYDHDVVFKVRSKFNNKSFATIVYCPGSVVKGNLYFIHPEEILFLDHLEDVELGTYQRIVKPVFCKNRLIEAWMYQCTDPYWLTDTLEPTQEYFFDTLL